MEKDFLKKSPQVFTDPSIETDLTSTINRMEAKQILLDAAKGMQTAISAALEGTAGISLGGSITLLAALPVASYAVTQIPVGGVYGNVAGVMGAGLYYLCPSCF